MLLVSAQAAALASGGEDGSALPAVVVTGTRSERTVEDSPVRTEVIDRRELERTNARTLPEALANLPGVQLREIHGRSGHEIWMQGLSGDQVLVLLDGLPLTATTGSTTDLSQIGLVDVEQIEVVKGASSVLYGSSAMGGVVNIRTRRIAPGLGVGAVADVTSRGEQNTSGRSLDAGAWRQGLKLEGGSPTLRAGLRVEQLADRGFTTQPDGWARRGDAVRRLNAGARIEWYPTDRSQLWLDQSAYRERSNQRSIYVLPPNEVPQSRAEIAQRARTTAGWNWTHESGWRADVRGLNESLNDDANSYSQGFMTEARLARFRTRHLLAQVDTPQLRSHRAQFGMDLHQDTLEQAVNGSSELDRGGASVRRSSRELFVQDEWQVSARWRLLGGVRWQHDSDFGTHFAPKLAAHWQANGAVWSRNLRLSYGEGYRAPNLKERHFRFDHTSLGYVVNGNPALKPESSRSLQLGAGVGWRERAQLDVQLFQNRLRDLIQIDTVPDGTPGAVPGVANFQYENVARARLRGVETVGSVRLLPALRVTVAHTWMQATAMDGATLTRRPRHMARLGVDWSASERTIWTVRSRYQGREVASVDPANGASRNSPSWFTADIFLNHRLDNGLTLFASLQNLFDRQRRFEDPNDFGPIQGRALTLGARYAWHD